jgi:hypothetical protein
LVQIVVTMGRRKVGTNSGYNGKEKVWYMEGSKVYRRLRVVCDGVAEDKRVKVIRGVEGVAGGRSGMWEGSGGRCKSGT